MSRPAQRQEVLPCRQCRVLRAQLLRCQRESEERAAQDDTTCRTIYAQMERLARLNMALVQQRQQPSGLGLLGPGLNQLQDTRHTLLQVAEEHDQKEEETLRDCRIQQLQATIVEQAKQLETLRRQLKSMVPLLPLDGARVGNQEREEDDYDAMERMEEEQEEEEEMEESAVRRSRRRERGLQKLPLTSLHAQLKSRDAAIRRLEQHAEQQTQEITTLRETKRRATQQYQQITTRQHVELKKSNAVIQAQQLTQRRLERRLHELQEYVAVLENKLLARR